MKPEWVAEIADTNTILSRVARGSTGYDVRVWEEEEDSSARRYFWSSPHLDVSTDVQVVQNRAAALRAVWDGALAVAAGGFTPVRLSVFRREGCHHADSVAGDPHSDPFAPEVLARPRRKLSSWENPLNDDIDLYLALARHDLGSRHRLQALGIAGVTLNTLFLLHDDMTKITKWDDEEIDKQGKAPIAVTARFRATVNNPTESGSQSRHGGPGTSPMNAAPVTLNEAAPVILGAYSRYLFKRADVIGLAGLV